MQMFEVLNEGLFVMHLGGLCNTLSSSNSRVLCALFFACLFAVVCFSFSKRHVVCKYNYYTYDF